VRFSNGSRAPLACLLAGLVACAAVPQSARAETSVGVHIGSSGFEFGFLYNDYYHADEEVIVGCREWMSEPDMVVALDLARVSGVRLDIILGWRRTGLTWYDITHRCRQDTHIYYVDLPEDTGPPYGRAIGYWRKHPKQDLRLSDDEVRGFVTLKALSDYSRRSPAAVLVERRAGKSPAQIAGKSHGKSEDAAPRSVRSEAPRKSEARGTSEGGGKGRGPGKSKGKK